MDTLLSRHLAALAEGDAAATAALYADDAELVSFDGVAAGRDAITQRYAQFYEYHGTISGVEVLHQQDAGDAQFVLFALESDRGRFELVNVYLAAGERIGRHFSNETKAAMARDEVVSDGNTTSGNAATAANASAGDAPTAGGEESSPEGTTATR